MGYTQFVIWAGKQGFKYGQKYLNKAWQEATKGGKVVLESQFPKLVNKAKDLYKNFKGFDPKVVSKTKVAPTFVAPKHTNPRFLAKRRSAKVIPFPKKPPGKADGGRIDKPLPTRSRDI